MKTKRLLPLLPLAALFAGPARAAELIAPVGGTYVYSQNFDSLFMPAAAGSVAATTGWNDNSTIPNWWFYYAANAVNGGVFAGVNFAYNGNDGSVAPAFTLNSQGAANNTDRAFAAPSTTGRGEQSGILVFQNTSAFIVSLSSLQYNGEVRRANATANNTESIFVWYRKAASEAEALTLTTAPASAAIFPTNVSTAPNAYYITGWTQLDSARFTYSNTTAGAVVNVSTPVIASGLSGIRVDPGEFFAIRFSNINDGGGDGLIGMDDLSITFNEISAAVDAAVSNVARDDNGTPLDPADDKMNFTLSVTGAGAVNPAGWEILSPASIASTGTYGVPSNFTGVPISEFSGILHELTASVQDAGNPATFANFTVIAPWCVLTASATGFTYDEGGTPDDAANDTVTYLAAATGTFTGPSYDVDTAPLQTVPYGSAATVISGPGTAQTLNFTDTADTTCTTQLIVNTPAIIGVNNLSGGPVNIKSAPAFGTRNWTFDGTARTAQQTSGTTQTEHVILSEVIDLSTIGGVTVSAALDATTGGSSGFEAADYFQLQIIVDGGAPVSILGAADVDNDGRLEGAATDGTPGVYVELPDAGDTGVTAQYTFSALVLPAANTLQLRIVGNSNSPAETLLFKDFRLEPAPPSIQVSAASNIQRIENGPGLADDTVTFDATVTGINAGPGWTTSTPGVTPVSGAYGTVTFTIAAPLPASPYTIDFQDAASPGIATSLAVAIPVRSIIAQRDFGGGLADVFTALGTAQSVLWVNEPSLRTLTITDGVNAQTETVTSEVLDLSTVGEVRFTAKLVANDTSTGSNFDTPDKFRAELIVDGGLPTESIINLVTPYDTGAGAPSTTGTGLNGAPDGWINGYTGAAGTNVVTGAVYAAGINDYDANRARDEFNPNGLNAALSYSAEFPFTAIVPASANTVQLRITSQGIQGTEDAVFQEALFVLNTAPLDSDSDGMSDDYENANGLDPNSAADKLTDLDGDGQSNYAEFLAGTAANNTGSTLKVLNVTKNGNLAAVTWASVPGKVYRIDISPDMAGWTDLGQDYSAAPGPATQTTAGPLDLSGLGAQTKYFLRVRVK